MKNNKTAVVCQYFDDESQHTTIYEVFYQGI